MARSYSFRLTPEGVEEAERKLKSFGEAGKAAFKTLTDSVPQFQDAWQRAQAEVDKAASKMAPANENVRSGFARVSDAAEKMEGAVKKGNRGLNDVRGTMELLGPLTGGAADGFGAMVRTIGNVGDAFGAFAALVRGNPLGVLVTVVGLAATAWLTMGGHVNSAAEAQKKYDEAIKASNDLMETASEKSARLAEETRRKTVATLEESLAIEKRGVSQLKAMRLAEQQLLLSNPQLKRDDSIFAQIDEQLRDRQGRVTDLEQRIKATQNPANDGATREAVAKAEADASAEAQKQYLQNIDERIAAEEEAMRTVAASKLSNHQLQDKIAKDFSDAQQKLAEEDARVQQEAAKLTNDFLVKEAERRDRDMFGAGAQRAVQDYWESLTQHGRRAQQFVSNSVIRPLEDSLAKFFATGKGKISDFFDAVKMGLARLAAQDVIGGIGSALGIGGGGGSSALMAGASAAGSFLGSLFGFKDGGSFKVGGSGGTDSQVVSFKATPGERVTITTPEQEKQIAAPIMASRLAGMGEGPDDSLIHVMGSQLPAIAAALGHAGSRNPRTGLLGFADSPDGGFGGSTDTGHDTATGSNAAGSGGSGGPGGGFTFGEVTQFDDYGEPSRPSQMSSPRSIGGEVDDRAVAAYNTARESGFSVDFSAHVASLSRALGPTADFNSLVGRAHYDLSMQNVGFFGRLGYALGDLVGIGRWGGFFSSPAASVLTALLTGLIPGVGLPGMLARGVASIGLNATRSAISGEPSKGIGSSLANALADVMTGQNSLGVSLGNHMGAVTAGIDRSLGLDGSRSFGVASNDNSRFGGINGQPGSLSLDAFGMSGAGRATAALADVAADLGGLRESLAGDYSAVTATGSNIMASLPRFHGGGSMTVPAGGERLVSLVANGGENVSVGTPGQLGAATKAIEGQTRVTAEGLERLEAQLAAVVRGLADLGRRFEEARFAA